MNSEEDLFGKRTPDAIVRVSDDIRISCGEQIGFELQLKINRKISDQIWITVRAQICKQLWQTVKHSTV